ncbi:MAG: HAMP domain-containing protein [Verrucomicrobia bacterium]|nr:HAMP domain-containing protein [Verrucomicrobiota bacterium]
MKTRSFKLHITLLFVLLAGTVLLAFGFQFLTVIKRIGYERVDRELEVLANSEARQPLGPNFTTTLPLSLRSRYGHEQSTKFIVRASDRAGKVLYVSPGWPSGLLENGLPTLPAASEKEERSSPKSGRMGRGPRGVRGSLGHAVAVQGPVFATVRAANESWRVAAVGNEQAVFLAGLSLTDVESDLRRSCNAFLVAVPVLLTLLFGAGWVLAGRALRPVKAIAQTTAGITAHRLSERVPAGRAAREFRQLIDVINEMLERLETSFHQAARFSADAAHELKTPLTVLQGQLESAIQQAAPGSEEQQRYNALAEEVQRLKSIVQKLLLLARADARQLTLNLEPVDLSALLASAAEDIGFVAPQLRVETEIQPGITVSADRALLRQAIGNLTSNAVKYNDDTGLVRLRLEAGAQDVRVTISNTGPAIPEEERPRIFERFYRASNSRSRQVDGAGLGLSLAREIARAHRGDLLLDATGESLTSFVLVLPRK